MSVVIFARRKGQSLLAADQISAGELHAIPEGAVVQIQIKRPRNLAHHRKYWALLQAVYPHQALYPTIEALAAAMKIATGLAEPIELPNGRLVYAGGSINFARMDQQEFEQFYQRAVQVILTRVLPLVDNTDLEREVQNILTGANHV